MLLFFCCIPTTRPEIRISYQICWHCVEQPNLKSILNWIIFVSEIQISKLLPHSGCSSWVRLDSSCLGWTQNLISWAQFHKKWRRFYETKYSYTKSEDKVTKFASGLGFSWAQESTIWAQTGSIWNQPSSNELHRAQFELDWVLNPSPVATFAAPSPLFAKL